jgi:hypothetical protein
MKSRWIAISALTVGILGLFLAPAFIGNHHQSLALLERLAPRIERAPSLPPETRDTILKLVDRVRNAPLDQRSDARRAIAIERVATALKAKEDPHELTSVGRRQD